MRFHGNDDEIDISAKFGVKAEFDAWRWASLPNVPTFVVPFKRGLYDRLVQDFAHLAVRQP